LTRQGRQLEAIRGPDKLFLADDLAGRTRYHLTAPYRVGTQAAWRTKVTQIYKKSGNLRAVQLLLGHTKMCSTVRYLGVELEDALAIAEAIEIWRIGPSSGRRPTGDIHHKPRCCGAARDAGLSLQAQNLVTFELTLCGQARHSMC